MTEIPKIVYDRLREVPSKRVLPDFQLAHPDADLLTAFSEHLLSAVERNGVLEHLTLCRDCRDVVALALPFRDIVAPPAAAERDAIRATAVAKSDKNRLTSRTSAWPSLRWAVLAAGIAVVASLLLLRPGKLNTIQSSSKSQPSTTAPAASGTETASASLPASPMPASAADRAAVGKTEKTRRRSDLLLSKKLDSGPVVTSPLQASQGVIIAQGTSDSGQPEKSLPVSSAGSLETPPTATKTVEVTGVTAVVEAAPFAEDGVMARNDVPAIARAKPAPQEVEVQGRLESGSGSVATPKSEAKGVVSAPKLAAAASPNSANAAIWAITAGALQRSLDNGQSWQNALHAFHPLLCFASHDNDVWAGGQAGTLFHSFNRGATWIQIQPSSKGEQLTSDITVIEVRGPEILLSTNNSEIWRSADSGTTWDKK